MKQTVRHKVGFGVYIPLFFISLVTISPSLLTAQPAISGRSLLVEATDDGSLYFPWHSTSSVPLMRAAIWLNLQEETIRTYNRLPAKQDFKKASSLRLPLQRSALLHDITQLIDPSQAVQIWYAVEKGETCFRIARHYAGCSLTRLVTLNGLKDAQISEGQKLLLGWILPPGKGPDVPGKVPQTIATTPPVTQMPVMNDSIPPKKVDGSSLSTPSDATGGPANEGIDDIPADMVPVEEEVIGGKVKHHSEGKAYFVLHDKAPPGSFMTIYNPMRKRRIKAKVLGPIPPGTYREEVKVILSAKAAKDLGIIDFRFKVVLNYMVKSEE